MGDQSTQVYFIQAVDGGPVKIGVARNPQRRLSDLQGGHPYELRIIGLLEGGPWLERQIHRRFQEHRLQREWFEPLEEILAIARGEAPPLIEPVKRPKSRQVPDPNEVWMDERIWNIRKDIEQLHDMGKAPSEIAEIFGWDVEKAKQEMEKMLKLGYFNGTPLRSRSSFRERRVA